MTEEGARCLFESERFSQDDKSGAYFSHDQRKWFSRRFEYIDPHQLRTLLDEKVPDGEFWFYLWEIPGGSAFDNLVAPFKLHTRSLKPIAKPYPRP